MANFDIAFEWMMHNEDPRGEYALVKDAPAPTGQAISGINSVAFPTEFAAVFAIPQQERLPAVRAFYLKNFWNRWFYQLDSDELAKRVFDTAVNMGPGTAVKLLQQALGPPVARDGAWGPATLQAANSAAPDTLVAAFRRARICHYSIIAENNPADAKFLAGWEARASK